MNKILDEKKSNWLVEFFLRCKGALNVEEAGEKGIDFIVKTKNETFAVFTRYRNFPETETKSKTLDREEEERIKKICATKYTPVIAYVFFDKYTERIYLILMTLDKMHQLVSADNKFLNQVLHGMDIKLGVGKSFSEQLYQELKKQVDTVEISVKNI